MANNKEKRTDQYARLAPATVFILSTVILLLRAHWAQRWIYSGAATLTLSLLTAGDARLLPFIPVYAEICLVNLAYAIAATSWLLFWAFAVFCYVALFVSCLAQSSLLQDLVRRQLRKVLRELQFTADKICLFDLPALEIDRDVDGLMVIRGVTISLSSLTIVAHGVEVGIKLSDDMELALVVDEVSIKLFRRIEIGDIYGNVKGGAHEMNFHELAPSSRDKNGEPLMAEHIINEGTPLLVAAGANADRSQDHKVRMTEEMTDGAAPAAQTAKSAFENIKSYDLDDSGASSKYIETLKWISTTSAIYQSRELVIKNLQEHPDSQLTKEDSKGMRAAICARLHHKPTVPHPPRRSVKVTTLQNLSSPAVRRFMHRLPLLLRLLLNPVAHFHPVFISSITAGGSGKWIQSMIESNVFKTYATDNSDIKNLQRRISRWLTDANFCLELVDIKGVAQVPVNTAFDIVSQLKFEDVLMYRTIAAEASMREVVRLGGADATVTVPSFLLPHHEHLLPPPPTKDDVKSKAAEIENADGKPQTVKAENALKQARKDETNVTLSTHVRLPACFDQQLLDFIAALVKASKLIEVDKDADDIIEEKAGGGLRELTSRAKETVKSGLKKATIDAMANDRWIAKLVGKITRKLESAQGDVGYSGNLPVALQFYRDIAESESKILP